VKFIRENPSTIPINKIKLDKINTGYYDKCLEYYCYQSINLGLNDNETCWYQNGLNTHCLGKYGDKRNMSLDEKFDYFLKLGKEKENFIYYSIFKAWKRNQGLSNNLKIDNEGWIYFNANIPYLNSGIKSKIKDKLRKALGYPKGKNILKIIKSIKKNGWDQNLASRPLGGVLGYSTILKKHHVITGKHRIASLKYLHSQDQIDGSTEIHYPIISYNWGNWKQWRPYPGFDLCDNCK